MDSMMSMFPADNLTAIAEATAKAANYVQPTVDQIFAAGMELSKVDKSKFLSATNIVPDAIFPFPFGDLYYNISFLWPQLESTGLIINGTDCTKETCSLVMGTFLYLPNIPANIFYTVIFGLALLVTIPLSIKYKTWGYLVGMIGGLLCEIIGYVGRILIAKNDFDQNPFYLYIICLTIGPAFLSFSVYTCLARIVVVYGKDLSRFKPRTYTYIFAVCDFVALALQGAGGGLAATGTDRAQSQNGINIMIGGLAFQIVSLTVFIVLCMEYGSRVLRRKSEIDPTYATLQRSLRFKGFQGALAVAVITIFVRSVFRVVELKEGFRSQYANNEITFMILEGGMIIIAVIALTAFHPGIVFGSQWREVSQVVKNSKSKTQTEKEGAIASYGSESSVAQVHRREMQV